MIVGNVSLIEGDEHAALLENALGGPTLAEIRQARKRAYLKNSRLTETREEDQFIENTGDKFSGCSPCIERTHEEYKAKKAYRKALNSFLLMGRTRNTRLRMYLRKQIKMQENFLLEVTGDIGMGKSLLALAWIHRYCKEMRRNPRYHLDPEHLADLREFILFPEYAQNGFIEIYVTYEFYQTLNIIQKVMRPSDVVFQDESPAMHGEGSHIEMDNLENCIRACSRRRWLNFIFVSPELYKIKQLHYIMDVIATNRDTFRTLAMVCLLRKSSSELSYKGVATFDVATVPRDVREWYHDNSDTIKERLQRLRGASTPTPGDLKTLATQLVAAFKALPPEDRDYYIDTKENMKELAMTIDETRTNRYTKEIANRAMWILGARKRKARADDETIGDDVVANSDPAVNFDAPMSQEDFAQVKYTGPQTYSPKDRFVFDEDKGLERLLAANKKKWAPLVEIYNKNVKQGIGQDVLSKEYHCSQPWISEIKKKVVGGLGRLMGNDYELHLKKYYDKTGKYQDIKTKGGQSGFDVIRVTMAGIIEVVSVKCYNTPRDSRSIKITKFNPEIKMVRNLLKKGKKARFFVHVYDHTQGRFDEREYDVRNLPSWVTVNI